jgi:hypothetical protein
MTIRLHTSTASPDGADHDTLVDEAIFAFKQDIVYAIQVVESARSLSMKKQNTRSRKKI